MATDPTTIPSTGDIQQAKKDMTDINTFVVSSQDDFIDNTGSTRKTLTGIENVSDLTISTFNSEAAAAILEMNKSRGFRVVGTFTDGFTYELFNDVGIDADDNSWIYIGAGKPNKFVAAGTVPSEGAGYKKVTFNAASGVLDSRGTNVQDYIDGNLTPFKNVSSMKSAAFLSTLPEYTRVEWQGRFAQSDGGSNWGVLRFGSHIDDGYSVFSINSNTYVKANLRGTNNVAIAGLFGGVTEKGKLQSLIDKTNGVVNFGYDKVYELDGGVLINGDNKTLNLNGSTLQFTTNTYSLYDKGNNNTIKNGRITTDYTPSSGGNGHAGSCITVGEQSTGDGQFGFLYDKLELTTNRTDAGAHISVIGGCYNWRIRNIVIMDNAVCRNLIGIEWGGTPSIGTQHPHNGKVSNIKVGKITTPTFGNTGYAYVVWASAAFNIKVSNITCESAYGLMIVVRGDLSNEYAPPEYKHLIGTGMSITEASIGSFYGYALRVIGSSMHPVPQKLVAKGIKATGGKIGNNNNFGLQAEFCDGVHLTDFKFDGVMSAGTTTGASANNILIENGEITGCELYASSIGGSLTKGIKPTIRRVNYHNNNTLGGTGSGTSAVVVQGSDDAVVEFCNFGKDGESETQRYSVYTAATANRPKTMHNHTYVNNNPAINPYLNGSETVYEANNTKDF